MEFETSKPSIQNFCAKVKNLKVTDVNELNTIIDQLNASQSFDIPNENKVISVFFKAIVDS